MTFSMKWIIYHVRRDICKLRLIISPWFCFSFFEQWCSVVLFGFFLFYFLMVIALTAVWAKGDDFLWVFASSQVRATLYQHILIKNYWKYTPVMLQDFSAKRLERARVCVCLCAAVRHNYLCVCACASVIKAEQHTGIINLLLYHKLQYTSWFRLEMKRHV